MSIESRAKTQLAAERIKLIDAQRALNDARIEIEKIKARIEFAESILNGESELAVKETAPDQGSGDIPRHRGKSSRATPWIIRSIKEANRAMGVQEIVDAIIAGKYGDSNGMTAKNLYSSVWAVLDRAAKNPNHPLFKKSHGAYDLQKRE